MFVRTLMALALVAVQSQPAIASAPIVVGPNEVRELVVQPNPKCLPAESAPAPAPRIVSTYPAAGQVVRPGLLVFQITFDRPMTCGGFLKALANVADPCPGDAQTVTWSVDRKTFRTLCVTHPDQAYGVMIGGDCAQPFVSLDGWRAPTLAVPFTTSDGPAVTSVSDALAADAGAQSYIPSSGPPANQGLAGVWQGYADGADFFGPLFMRVDADAQGTLAATLDAPLRRVFDLALERVRRDGRKVEFTLPAVGGWDFVGTLSADGASISGLWTRGESSVPTVFKCTLGRTVRRPNGPLVEVLTAPAAGSPENAP